MKKYSDYYHTKVGLIRNILSNQRKNCKRRGHKPPEYSSDEFIEWIFSNKDFERLYSNWKESKFDKMLVPSVDRLDDDKTYSFDNIRLITWQENFDKGNNDRKTGKKITIHRSVEQLDLSGKKIDDFFSIASASRLTGVQRVSIYKVCLGYYHTAGGFYWRYKN